MLIVNYIMNFKLGDKILTIKYSNSLKSRLKNIDIGKKKGCQILATFFDILVDDYFWIINF